MIRPLGSKQAVRELLAELRADPMNEARRAAAWDAFRAMKRRETGRQPALTRAAWLARSGIPYPTNAPRDPVIDAPPAAPPIDPLAQ